MAVKIISFIGLIVIFTLYFLTKGMYLDEIQHIGKKEYKLKDLMPTSLWILDKVFDKRLKPNSRVRDYIMLIYGKREYHYRLRMHEAEKIALGVMGLIGVLFISLILSIQDGNGIGLTNNTLKRPSLGEGNKQYDLQAEIDIDGEKEVKTISVWIPEKNPDKELAKKMLQEAAGKLNNHVLGSNSTTKMVDQKLNLIKNYPDANIKIDWVIDTPTYIGRNGELKYNNISKNGNDARITATLTYAGEQNDKTLLLKVYPKTLSEEERRGLIEQALQEQLKLDHLLEDGQEDVTLPTKLEGHDAKIRWLLASENNDALTFLLLGLLIVIFLMLLKDYEVKKKVEERNQEIRRSFPEFVIKLTLLINAGMTLSRAWKKISKDYYEHTCRGQKKEFLYEEMLETLQEINNGVSEGKAYEGFGKRCRIPEMMRFTSVIVQNVRKGNDTLVMALRAQANEAWDIRKNAAKKAGEKASSKLLLPMGIMFVIIIIIVMMPAFLALGL